MAFRSLTPPPGEHGAGLRVPSPMPNPRRRTLPRARYRAALAVLAGLIALGILVSTPMTPAQRAVPIVLVVLAAVQAVREWRKST